MCTLNFVTVSHLDYLVLIANLKQFFEEEKQSSRGVL